MRAPARTWKLALLLPAILAGSIAPRTSPQGLPDLAKVVANLRNALQAARSLSLDVEIRTASGNRIAARLVALRPNFFKVEGERQSFYSDGTSAWQYFPLSAVYTPFQKNDVGMLIPLTHGFEMYSPTSQFKPDYTGVEDATFEGKRVVALIEEPREVPNLRIRTFLDPQSWVPVGYEQKLVNTVDVTVYSNVRTDRQLSAADFAWTPPKGAVDGRTVKRDGPKLLQAGETAPDFELPLTNGARITLSEALTGKRGLLLNFWFINCGYCLLELPEFADLYRHAGGLELVAVNDEDAPAEIQEFVKRPNYPFPVAIDVGARVAAAYRVKDQGHPITYVIRPDRTIAYVQVGYDTDKKLAKLEEELAKLGIARRTPSN